MADTPLRDDELFSRIDVTPPYFALRDVKRTETGHIVATAPVEQPLGFEDGPLSGAEAGRHLAICGSIAAAWANPKAGKFHYLATDAEIRRAKGASPSSIDHILLSAHASAIDKRTMHAIVTAADPAGKPVCSLSCYYAVVKHDVMRTLFADHAVEAAPAVHNPYIELIEPDRVDIAGGHIEIGLGPVDAAQCAGHFDGLPAMPVAYLMANVTEGGGRLLSRQYANPDLKFTVLEGSVRADGLAFAGEDVVLRGEHQGNRYGMDWLYLEAFADDTKRVGAVHLKVKTTGGAPAD